MITTALSDLIIFVKNYVKDNNLGLTVVSEKNTDIQDNVIFIFNDKINRPLDRLGIIQYYFNLDIVYSDFDEIENLYEYLNKEISWTIGNNEYNKIASTSVIFNLTEKDRLFARMNVLIEEAKNQKY